MTVGNPARNPVVWGWDQIQAALAGMEAAHHRPAAPVRAVPQIRRLRAADLRAALAEGWDDFRADPTHYVFLCALYPAVGLVLGRLASGTEALPLLFPLVAGFSLLGPFAAVGLYELSRKREAGQPVAWWHAFAVFDSPAIDGILKLGLLLAGLFVLWLVVAETIYLFTVAPLAPGSAGALLGVVFGTWRGWALLVLGNGIGFLFAVAALVLGVVSFPMMVDRGVGVELAMQTSLHAVRANRLPMAGWGLIVAIGLVAGSLPLLLGLAVTVPVLAHATWHLYRRAVVFDDGAAGGGGFGPWHDPAPPLGPRLRAVPGTGTRAGFESGEPAVTAAVRRAGRPARTRLTRRWRRCPLAATGRSA